MRRKGELGDKEMTRGERERWSKRKRERDILLLIRGDDQPKTVGEKEGVREEGERYITFNKRQ